MDLRDFLHEIKFIKDDEKKIVIIFLHLYNLFSLNGSLDLIFFKKKISYKPKSFSN